MERALEGSPLRRRLLLAAALAVSCACVVQATFARGAQWDLRIFRAMGRAFFAGESPYVAAGGLPFLYPPLAVPLLAPLSVGSERTAVVVLAALKVLALFGLAAIWRKLGLTRGTALEVVVALFAFGSALLVDFASGNPSLFEQLALWFALFALLQGRIGWFCVAVVLTAQLKLAPAVLLAALLLVPSREDSRATRALPLAIAAFVALLALQAWLAPDAFHAFAARVAQLDQRGPDNPSLLAFLRDVVPSRAAATGLWATGVAALGALALRCRGLGDARTRALLATVTYVLVAPQLIVYGYVLLLPAAFHLLRRGAPSIALAAFVALPHPRGVKLLAPAGILFERYQPLAAALLLYLLLVRELRAQRYASSSTE